MPFSGVRENERILKINYAKGKLSPKARCFCSLEQLTDGKHSTSVKSFH